MDLWTVLGIGIAVVIIGLAAVVFAVARRPSVEDLGSVSNQWIVEHRASQSEGTVR